MNSVHEEEKLERVFPGSSKMGQRMRTFDWVQTAVGPTTLWPLSLRAALSLMLGSPHPMLIWWGRQLIHFYNDSYAEAMLGATQPWMLGCSARNVFADVWTEIGPRVQSVIQSGNAASDDEVLLILERNGYLEETYHSFAYTPIPDERGNVGGIGCHVSEQTQQVLARRRRQLLDELTACVNVKGRPLEQMLRAAGCVLESNPLDIPFALIYLMDAESGGVRLSAAAGMRPGEPGAPLLLDRDTLAALSDGWTMGKVMATGRPEIVSRLGRRFGVLPGGAWLEPPHTAAVMPMKRPGQQNLAGFFICGVSPRRELDASYLDFFQLVANCLADAVVEALAETGSQQLQALMPKGQVQGADTVADTGDGRHDAAERMRIEDALRRSEAQLAIELTAMSRLHDLSSRLLSTTDMQAALREVLDAAIGMLGAEMGNIQLYNPHKRTLEIVVQRGFCQEFLDYFRDLSTAEESVCAAAARTGRRIVVADVMRDPGWEQLRAPAGSAGYRGVQSTPLVSRNGSLLGILSTHFRHAHSPSERDLRTLDLYAIQAIDQIERIRAEEALRDSETKFRALAEASPALIWQFDPRGNAVYLNPRIDDLLGRSATEAMGAGWHKLMHPEDADAYLATLKSAQQERRRLKQRVRMRGRDGAWHWMESHALPLHDAEGNYAGHVGISLDITEAVLFEQALKEADRRKDEFIATLAHELRNPLAPVRNAIRMLPLAAGPHELERLQQMMERQVDHMVRLVDDLMEVSRITTGKIELRRTLVGLADVLGSAVETSMPNIDHARHRLSISLPTENLMLDADAVRMAQVFANLLNNAAKYTEDGGHIWMSAQKEGSEAVVEVSDSGIGISANMLPCVFDMFAQTIDAAGRWQSGIGIGLHLVRRLVEMHGGRVDASSAGPGRGSRFVVRLPLVEGCACPLPHETVPGGELRRRVLIVDDNRDAAESLAMLLEHFGAQVQVAHDGLAALQAIEAGNPDAVLLDIGMPGMDGYEVAREIRRQPRFNEMLLVALSGWGGEEDRRRSNACGFDHHLVKPVDIAVLRALLDAQ